MSYLKRAALSFLLFGGFHAFASPPPNVDLNSPEAKWVQSLKSDNGVYCCSLADCRKVEYRIMDDHYQVYVTERWVDVPPKKVLKRENPTGTAWLCYDQTSVPLSPDRIFCFVGLDMF
jgi:hypothetical protein